MIKLTPIGDCFSGLKYPNGRYNRVALATRRAIEKFDRSYLLQNAVDQLGLSPAIKPAHFTMQDANIKVFIGRNDALSVGLWLRSPDEEIDIFKKGLAAFRSLARGEHRQLFFLRTGVNVPPEINELAPDLYSALLAKLKDGYHQNTLDDIVAIAFTEKPLDMVTEGEGGKTMLFSLPQLRTHRSWAHFEEDEGL
jgi:hypothetical protein